MKFKFKRRFNFSWCFCICFAVEFTSAYNISIIANYLVVSTHNFICFLKLQFARYFQTGKSHFFFQLFILVRLSRMYKLYIHESNSLTSIRFLTHKINIVLENWFNIKEIGTTKFEKKVFFLIVCHNRVLE